MSPQELGFYERLGAAIREGRNARGWTLYDVAEAVGVSAATVSRWERAEDRMKAYQLHRFRCEGLLP